MQEAADEAASWAAALAGDGQAFNHIFRLHRDDVFRYARRLTDSPTDADDITASTFLELWHRRDAVRLVNGSVKPWLLVTAANIARNLRRSTRRWRAVLQQLPRDHDDPDPAAIAAAHLDAQHGRSPLAAALRRLPAIDTGLLTLTVFEGYTVADAAQILGITDATARSRLSRARARLRAQLHPEPLQPHTAARKQS